MTTIKKPINYLNNKDILKEIHTSKNSYCSFKTEEDNKYDLIVDFPHEPLERSFEYMFKEETLEKAKEKRAARIFVETGEKIDCSTILTSDLVFRVMTWDHIPLSNKKPKKVEAKKSVKEIFAFEEEDSEPSFEDLEDVATKGEVDDMVHVKVNFPPFQHYKIEHNNSVECVGKSHWKGSIDGGEFGKDHGQITDKLARIYIMMCEKYAMKYNWRGYTYNDEMRNSGILQLTYVGLRFNEAKSVNPFSYFTQVITNSFLRILNLEKKGQNLRDDILEMNGLNPSYTRQFNNSRSLSSDGD